MAAARSRLHKMVDGATELGSRVPAVEYVSILRGAKGLQTGTGYGLRGRTVCYSLIHGCGRRGVVRVAYKYRERWRGTTEVQMRVYDSGDGGVDGNGYGDGEDATQHCPEQVRISDTRRERTRKFKQTASEKGEQGVVVCAVRGTMQKGQCGCGMLNGDRGAQKKAKRTWRS